MTLFGSIVHCRDQVHDSVQQRGRSVKSIFQVEGNTFRPIFFGYFIADWLLYNFAAGSFHTMKLCSRLYSTEIGFYSEKLKNQFLSHPLGYLGVTYALPSHLQLVGKSMVDFLFDVIELFSLSLTPETMAPASVSCLCVLFDSVLCIYLFFVLLRTNKWLKMIDWDVISGNLSKSAFFHFRRLFRAEIKDNCEQPALECKD